MCVQCIEVQSVAKGLKILQKNCIIRTIYLYELYIHFYVLYNVIRWRSEVQSFCLYFCSSIIGLMRPIYQVKTRYLLTCSMKQSPS